MQQGDPGVIEIVRFQVGQGISRDEEDRQGGGVGPDPSGQVSPVEPGHDQIDHQVQLVAAGLQERQRGRAVTRLRR